MLGAQQLGLDLPVATRFGRDDFLISPSNEAAFLRFDSWPQWPESVHLLLGPTGVGKSHLAAIWAARANAKTVPAADLTMAALPGIVAGGALVVEDADQVSHQAPGQDAVLFHLLNLARASGCWLVLTARGWPDTWGLATPDLLSRLRLAPASEIAQPDDALVRAVLVKLFVDRQLMVDTSVVDYLALRIDRSLAAARSVVAALDREAIARNRPVTRPMAAEILRVWEEGNRDLKGEIDGA